MLPLGIIICPPHCHYYRRCPQAICPAEALSSSSSSSAVPHITAVIVIHGPLILQRPHPCHYLVEALSPLGIVVCPHILVILIHRSFLLWRTCPHHCLVGVLSSLPHIVIIICGPLVLQRPHPSPRHHHHRPQDICPVEASLPLLFGGGLLLLLGPPDCPCLIIVVVVW